MAAWPNRDPMCLPAAVEEAFPALNTARAARSIVVPAALQSAIFSCQFRILFQTSLLFRWSQSRIYYSLVKRNLSQRICNLCLMNPSFFVGGQKKLREDDAHFISTFFWISFFLVPTCKNKARVSRSITISIVNHKSKGNNEQ